MDCDWMATNLSVEGHEENEVLDSGDGEHQGCSHWVVAREDERLESVEEDEDELHELDGGEVLLPPEVGLQGGATGCQQVVEVHQGVHPRVQERAETALPSSDKPWAPPAEEGEGAVVDDVQGGEVGKLFLQDEEEGVKEVDELGEVVPPRQVQSSSRDR